MEVLGRDIGAAPFTNADHTRITVAVVTPWRVGGWLRLRLSPLSPDETQVEVSGLGRVRRDVRRVIAGLTNERSA
jgi:hypothetical protein